MAPNLSLTRRTFLKGTAAAGGALAASRLLYGPLETLVAGSPAAPLAAEDKWVPTTCWIGKQECGILARVINGRVVKLEGHPSHPRNRGTLCPKGVSQIGALYDFNRVKTPLVRTNGKGVTGTWRTASWDEALTLVGDQMKEVMERDPRLLIWQKGRSKAKKFYDSAFVNASGATKLHHGAYCSDAGYRSQEYTIGLHGVLHPDFRHTRYLLSLGWDAMNGGGNKFCQITWHQQFLEARDNGMKVTHVDPWGRGMGPFADRWLPIKPSTDLAFLLAIAKLLIADGFIDAPYLKNHTNSPFLVKDDGTFLRVDDKEQVWDAASGSARPHDEAGIDPALEGQYTVGGARVKTAFELFKEHVASATPEWAASITGLSAESIRQVARELGENARIGSTIVIDGVTLPYRPVGIMAYHITQQELGFQMIRMATMVFMLLGAVEAVGGLRTDTGRSIHKNWTALDEIDIKDSGYNIYLKGSKFFPINSNNSSIVAHAMLEPEKWGVDYTPEVLIVHMANPLLSFADQRAMIESYKKFKFVAVIDPWLSETADFFADVVLPAATMEKYEGPMSVTDQYTDATTLRIPPMEPLFQSRGDIDIYLDLCEKAGILFGEDGYIAEINSQLKLSDEYKLDVNVKPEVRDIFDRWAKDEGYEGGIRFFETTGVKTKPIPTEMLYAPAWDPPYGGIRHRLYGESLMGYRQEMRALDVPEFFWRQYTAFPTWMTPTMEGSPDIYNLYLISHKLIEFKQSRTTFVPLLNELAPEQGLEINPKTAKARGIEDGDEIWVEAHNAVTGETRRVKTKARYLESIMPQTVALPHHYGFWVNPINEGQGPTANELFFSGEGYVSNTADQSFQVKVQVTKA